MAIVLLPSCLLDSYIYEVIMRIRRQFSRLMHCKISLAGISKLLQWQPRKTELWTPDGTGLELQLHTSALGTFLLYPLALSMPICNENSHSTRALESHKHFIAINMLRWKVCDFPQSSRRVGFYVANPHT